MTPEEKLEKVETMMLDEAKEVRALIHENTQYPQERANEASIEFIKLEVQLATLLLGLTGVFWNVYASKSLPSGLGNFEKISFTIVFFFLIGSLALGLLYLKIVERYWDRVTHTKAIQFNKWQEVIREKISFADAKIKFGEAIAYQSGTKLDKGLMVYTPDWPWILQTILLAVSLAIIFCLAVKLIVIS